MSGDYQGTIKKVIWSKKCTCGCSMWITGPETSDMFARSCCGCFKPILWRLPIMLWALGTIIWSIITFWGPKYLWPIYMTHWGLILILLQSIFGVTVAIAGCRKRLPDSSQPLPCYVKTYWMLYNTAIPIALLISMFYWLLLKGMLFGILYPTASIPDVTSTTSAGIVQSTTQSTTPSTTSTTNTMDTTPALGRRRRSINSSSTTPITIMDNIKMSSTKLQLLNFNTTTQSIIRQTMTRNDTSEVNTQSYKLTPLKRITSYNNLIQRVTIRKRRQIYENHKFPALDPILNITIHGVNSAVMLFELVVSAHPSRMFHIYQPLMFGLGYMLFGVIYFYIGGVDPFGNPWIYPVIDWSKPHETGIIVALSALYLALLHVIVVIIASVRDAIGKLLRGTTTVEYYDCYAP